MIKKVLVAAFALAVASLAGAEPKTYVVAAVDTEPEPA